MKLCTCKHCKKVFYSRMMTYTCSDCSGIDEMLFRQICAYLKNYPNSNTVQIADALGISAFTVMKYIEEGRLVRSSGTFDRIKDGEDYDSLFTRRISRKDG